MSLFTGFLTFLLVVNCLFLILVILMQLPKKEAGLGTAFGGGAADALFGAGTGNVLTTITKYATGCFFVLSIVLTVLNARQSESDTNEFQEALDHQAAQVAPDQTGGSGAGQSPNLLSGNTNQGSTNPATESTDADNATSGAEPSDDTGQSPQSTPDEPASPGASNSSASSEETSPAQPADNQESQPKEN